MRYPQHSPRGAEFCASYLSSSPKATEDFAAALASVLQAGDVILAYGDLGAGKTCFARGLARGLQVRGQVASPSFTYLREHAAGASTGLALYHFDCYRFFSSDSWLDLGFDEYFMRPGVLYIEWPERVEEYLPEQALRLYLNPGETPAERQLELIFPPGFPESRCLRLTEVLPVGTKCTPLPQGAVSHGLKEGTHES